MKLTISLSASVDSESSKVTKVLKVMIENPNVGKIGSLLYKLPGMKLSSIRPANHLLLYSL